MAQMSRRPACPSASPLVLRAARWLPGQGLWAACSSCLDGGPDPPRDHLLLTLCTQGARGRGRWRMDRETGPVLQWTLFSPKEKSSSHVMTPNHVRWGGPPAKARSAGLGDGRDSSSGAGWGEDGLAGAPSPWRGLLRGCRRPGSHRCNSLDGARRIPALHRV